jgi:hypothetical protein
MTQATKAEAESLARHVSSRPALYDEFVASIINDAIRAAADQAYAEGWHNGYADCLREHLPD